LFAAGANAAHGLRRSNRDKQLAVRRVLELSERLGHAWGDAVIAHKCGVSDRMVASVRKANPKLSGSGKRRGKDGKSRRAPKQKVKLGRGSLIRDWRKISGVRRKFTALADRWRSERPDVAAGFEGVLSAIAKVDELMAAKPVAKPEAAAPPPPAGQRKRRIVTATGTGGAS
jgi:hypothetical protein